MDRSVSIAVIIPALNEERAIASVIGDLPPCIRQLIVVDNGSTDRTGEIAAELGATVVLEPERGYGRACLAGMAALKSPDVVVFLDGDYSDHPDELPQLVAPIAENRVDLTIGSRVLGERERGALTPQARFGNALATMLIRALFGVRFTDLGPFRAIGYEQLLQLDMADCDYGWTVEMQVKAARLELRCCEIPVSYRRRIGVSKISGTVIGSIRAGYKILWTIFRYAVSSR